MDDLWNHVRNKFHLCVPYLPAYKHIIDTIVDMKFIEIPNILLYGAKGIPFNFVWEEALEKNLVNILRQNMYGVKI